MRIHRLRNFDLPREEFLIRALPVITLVFAKHREILQASGRTKVSLTRCEIETKKRIRNTYRMYREHLKNTFCVRRNLRR